MEEEEEVVMFSIEASGILGVGGSGEVEEEETVVVVFRIGASGIE